MRTVQYTYSTQYNMWAVNKTARNSCPHEISSNGTEKQKVKFIVSMCWQEKIMAKDNILMLYKSYFSNTLNLIFLEFQQQKIYVNHLNTVQ